MWFRGLAWTYRTSPSVKELGRFLSHFQRLYLPLIQARGLRAPALICWLVQMAA